VTQKWAEKSEEMKAVKWRRIYTEYVVPLSKLFRALCRSYTRRSQDEELRQLIKEYTAGCRAVLGEAFMENKGLWHRSAHLPDQAAGKFTALCGAKCSLSVNFGFASRAPPGGGGSSRNFGTRCFEAKHQDPKRTTTNHKDCHLQMVVRENHVAALQFLASGESWTAVEIDTKRRHVVREHSVTAGKDLVELINKLYPKLNLHVNSVAVHRDCGSSVLVTEEGDTIVEHNLAPERVRLRGVVYRDSITNHRPLPVRLFPDEHLMDTVNWRTPGFIAVPSSALDQLTKYFPGVVDEDWFESTDLQAFTAMDVYTEGEFNNKQFQLTVGSHVSVRIGE